MNTMRRGASGARVRRWRSVAIIALLMTAGGMCFGPHAGAPWVAAAHADGDFGGGGSGIGGGDDGDDGDDSGDGSSGSSSGSSGSGGDDSGGSDSGGDDSGSDDAGDDDSDSDAADDDDADDDSHDDDDRGQALSSRASGVGGFADGGEQSVQDELIALNPTAETLRLARALGLEVVERINARALSLRMVRFRVPPERDAQLALALLGERGEAAVARQHLYRTVQGMPTAEGVCETATCQTLRLIGWPDDALSCGAGQVIGIVDTPIHAAHPGLTGARLLSRSFIDAGKRPAGSEHGTAVAGLLVGRADKGFPGMLPRARLYAASPFFAQESGGETADTSGLVKSLDWLVQQGVNVIGLSLAGPDNAVLQAAIDSVIARGVVVVAAAGNQGPNAPAAYPAAFDKVIGVTAINSSGQVYRRANQGVHVDYALPGVNVWTLDERAGGKLRSGTSFAVPHMLALASQTLAEGRVMRDDWLDGERVPARDLGAPGRDPVFGWGVPRFEGRCR